MTPSASSLNTKTDIRLKLKRPHVNQKTIIDAAKNHRFVVAACGRRFGKTEAGKETIIRKAMQGKWTWWLMQTHQAAEAVWRDLKYTLRPLDKLITVSESNRRIETPTAGFIEVRSTASYDSLRGAGLDYAVLDEAAFMESDVWDAIVRPMLLERKGGALFLSSPNGQNHFHRLYQRGLDPSEPDWQSFHYTCYDNPLIDPAELDAIQRSTPERVWQEEYLAEFLGDTGAVFRNVRECATVERGRVPDAEHRYVFGVDWARSSDFTVIAIVDMTTGELVGIDRFNGIGWELQRGRLKTLYELWKPTTIYAESNSIGSPNIEALQYDGLPVQPFETTARSKPPLIEGLALAIERKDIALLNDEVLIHELVSYTLERTASGYRYNAPPGGHDDTVIATALAWHGVMQGSGILLDFW